MSKPREETPLMKQYYTVKEKYPGAVVLFRVGDFYETFGDDAVKTSKALGIILTKRGNGSASEIELAGFPHHSLDSYMPKLVRAGYRVAICDQLEDPKLAKGIVKRGVTELVTPGVVYSDHVLSQKHNNYLACLHVLPTLQKAGLALVDITTGEFMVAENMVDKIEKLLHHFQPSEVIFDKGQKSIVLPYINEKFNTYGVDEWVYAEQYTTDILLQQFGTLSLKGFGVQDMQQATICAGAILHYLKSTEHHELQHIKSISRIEEENYVWMDRFTVRSLELIYPNYEGGVALIDIIDKTLTPMGSRAIRKWLLMPLKQPESVMQRQNIVTYFMNNPDQAAMIADLLKPIGDMERIISKVSAKRINPRELLQLKKALAKLKPIQQTILDHKPTTELSILVSKINLCEYLYQKLENELNDELPLVSNQGGLFKKGVDKELDELRDIAYSGKDTLMQITRREIERTEISSLKIQYNKVFGYYLEVTNAHKSKVPADWIRKQTTVGAERYITPELKVYEEKILNAEDRINGIEYTLYQKLVNEACEFIEPIQHNAKILAELDIYLSFREISIKNNYTKPLINDGYELKITAGRHPVIETQLPAGESFIPNDISIGTDSNQIMIITGPNMAGKSAILRQTAIITILAQTGCYVPAQYAEIGVVDKIFTRVGASDNLSKGESTFMVEMTETASILNNISEKSLLLLDEIGRGTSTYDGISIAWAIVEYLHNHPKYRPKTLFATHYHELSDLANTLQRVKNYNVSVKQSAGKIIFLRKLVEGGSEHSFGIHVAQLAGMPNEVVLRADDIMHELEKDKVKDKALKKVKDIPKINYQMSLFEANDPQYVKAKELLSSIDINTLSPVEALLKLNELKNVWERK
ncbi:MAG: DNA mismatch repair protein MutS [Cytophagales bacterium]|nr:DNA mismatch repair protein MutS [Cytophagales bacterium]